MEKLLSAFLVLSLLICCIASFSSCDIIEKILPQDNEEKTPEAEKTPEVEKKPAAPEVPEGYKLFKNDDISFAYPDNWGSEIGSITILQELSTSNYILVVYEAKTTMYDDMTVSEFKKMMQPSMSSAGLTISNVSISKEKTNNLDVIKITYDISSSGVKIAQTIFITHVDDKTYSITLTEVMASKEVKETLFKTLYAIED